MAASWVITARLPQPMQVAMRTLQDCQLAISVYPTFAYDARSGGGVAETSGHGCA